MNAQAKMRNRVFGAAIAALMVIGVSGCDGGMDSGGGSGRRVVRGQTQVVSGAEVISYAILDNDVVTQVGVVLPLAVVQNPPAQPGQGPLGAIAVLRFPVEALSTTFLDHFELHWNPGGHPPERYAAGHFDFHFYNMTEQEVRQIAPPDPTPPAADRIPQGYVYPGPEAAVPQMGVHALPAAELAPGAPPFTASMLLGYWGGRMTFLEPMITQTLMLQKTPISLDVPRPAVLGRATRYPTKFTASFDPQANTYQLVMSDFVAMAQ